MEKMGKRGRGKWNVTFLRRNNLECQILDKSPEPPKNRLTID